MRPSPRKGPLFSAILKQLVSKDGSQRLSLSEFTESAGARGFGLLIGILALPSALPVPAVGYSVPFGFMILLLGLQMLSGRSRPWLPAWASALTIKRSTMEKILAFTDRAFHWLERFIHPRFSGFYRRMGLFLGGLVATLMGLLMLTPIPSTNTLPAIVVVFVALGLTEADGLLLLLAVVAGVVAILMYSLLIVGMLYVLF